MAEVRIGEEAEAEYTEALAWYQTRSPRSARRFEAAIAATLEQIGESPDRFPACDEEGYRFVLLDRFLYRLIYRVVGTVVQVVAVAHARRRPGYWSGRA